MVLVQTVPIVAVERSSQPPTSERATIARIRHYVSIKYTERLAEAGIEPSVGSVGDSYNNALAETIKDVLANASVARKVYAAFPFRDAGKDLCVSISARLFG